MGCLPTKSANNQTEVNIETIDNLNDLKVGQHLFVQAGEGDPYAVYDESTLLGEGTFGKVFKMKSIQDSNK